MNHTFQRPQKWALVTLSLTVLLGLAACYFEAPSSDLAAYQARYPEHAHDPQIQFILNDFKGLSSKTLETNAIPLKLAVSAVVMKRNEDQQSPISRRTYNQVLGEYGFIMPDRIDNLQPGVPMPKLEYPLGVVRGTLEVDVMSRHLKLEVGNLTCVICHSGRTYDSFGRPQNTVWMGAPNTSLNIGGYVEEIYAALKNINGKEEKLITIATQLFPNMDEKEAKTFREYLIKETKKQLDPIVNGSDHILNYVAGPPGSVNSIGSFKRVFGITKPGQYDPNDRGFANIPDLSYRAFRRNMTVDGIYSLKDEQPFTPISESEATASRVSEMGMVAAIFPIPIMGVEVEKTEENIEIMKDIFGNWVSGYQAPKFPGPINPELARGGEQIFKNRCSQCHGEYTPGIDSPRLVMYPNKLIPLEKIGTDPVRVQSIPKKLIKKFTFSWISERLDVQTPQGYMAPILANVWSTAPYFHNGSIPTLWALMNPQERPVKFKTGGHALDFEKVGVAYPEGYTPWSRPVEIDTTQSGHSNKGHEKQFESLSQDDKKSLIEYLKLL